MKENKYQIDEAKLSGDMVNEPVAAYRDAAVAESTVSTHDMYWDENEMEEDDEAYNTDSYPLGRSLQQVQEHCAQFEELRKDASRWSTWEEVNERLHQKHPWLR